MQILRLNLAGQPIDWINWQQAANLYARDLVCWTIGSPLFKIRGGWNQRGERSQMELPSILACGGKALARPHSNPLLTNRALFERDNHQCLYCGKFFLGKELTRDHIIPRCRGGKDKWVNVVAACRRCNQYKGHSSLEDSGMELLALPYRPNPSEYLALVNSRRILPEQAEFLSKQFSKNCRWQMNNLKHLALST